VLSAVAVGVNAAPPAGAAQNGAWSVYPTPNPTPRLNITTVVRAGTTLRDSVIVTNMTGTRLSFNLYAADAVLTPSGAFSLARRTDPKRGVAAWVRLPYDTLALAPHSAIAVPFTITVPKDEPAGDEPGGIVAELRQGAYTQRGSLGVTVLEAVGTRLYVRVDGPIRPALAVRDLHITARRSASGLAGGPVDATVSYTVRNTGNVLITTETAHTQVHGQFGSKVDLPPLTLPGLLRGSELHVTQKVRGIEPFVVLHATVTVTAPTATARASEATVVIPWLALAIIALAIGLSVWWWLRRRARPGPTDPSPPEPDEEPSLATVG